MSAETTISRQEQIAGIAHSIIQNELRKAVELHGPALAPYIERARVARESYDAAIAQAEAARRVLEESKTVLARLNNRENALRADASRENNEAIRQNIETARAGQIIDVNLPDLTIQRKADVLRDAAIYSARLLREQSRNTKLARANSIRCEAKLFDETADLLDQAALESSAPILGLRGQVSLNADDGLPGDLRAHAKDLRTSANSIEQALERELKAYGSY